jgi:allophanate hydrolase subunit 1
MFVSASGLSARHTSHRCATIPDKPGWHNRWPVLAAKIRSLLYSLSPSTNDETAPKIQYWIEYVIAEEFTTIDDLVERVSSVAWGYRGSRSNISRFLKELRDAPHRSEP